MPDVRLTDETARLALRYAVWWAANPSRCYLPEWLLKIWNMSADRDRQATNRKRNGTVLAMCGL